MKSSRSARIDFAETASAMEEEIAVVKATGSRGQYDLATELG
jgi:hypothetical protein